MNKYISPKLVFQKVELFEKIADKCWGYGKAVYNGFDIYGKPVTVYAQWDGNGCCGGLPYGLVVALFEANVNISGLGHSLANTKAPEFTPLERS
ncbi:MAG TPA: hypothetical protein GX401_07565 [Clostridiales bacterium]|nr:hypothetical protein [Clostridiales bacterium]